MRPLENFPVDTRGEKPALHWRVKTALYVAPVLMALAGLFYLNFANGFAFSSVRTEGTVVKVYPHAGEFPFDHGETTYSVVIRYRFADGLETDAGATYSSPDYGFDVGERIEILYDPREKGDVIIPGFLAQWGLPFVLFVVAAALLALSLTAHFLILRRWDKRSP